MCGLVPDTIGPAPSARAKCRGCGRAIEKGALRFGEADANPFGEGEAMRWFHLECAALRRPERFGPALDTASDLAERDRLRVLVQNGLDHPRLVRLAGTERAPSGRAHCRHCREVIEKGALRIALELWEEGRFTAIGFVHAACSSGYFETRECLLERIRLLSPAATSADLEEWEREIAKESPPRVELPEKAPAEGSS